MLHDEMEMIYAQEMNVQAGSCASRAMLFHRRFAAHFFGIERWSARSTSPLRRKMTILR